MGQQCCDATGLKDKKGDRHMTERHMGPNLDTDLFMLW